jgi:chromosomal replication initiator protein
LERLGEAFVDKRSGDPIWEQALRLIADQVNEGTYRIWFEPTVGLGLAKGTYSVGVASDFARDWIDSRFRVLMSDATSQVVGEPVAFEIVVTPGLSHAQAQDAATNAPSSTALVAGTPVATGSTHQPRRTVSPSADNPRPVSSRPGPLNVGSTLPAVPDDPILGAGLMAKNTFDSFVVGQSNRFAHAASLAAAETPGTQYNPLFIYGGVGLGKTHLLQAIGNYALRNHQGLKVRCLSVETFTNDFINSLRDDSIEGFKNRYRTIDVLLIDDIQFLQKKEQTQEEFFHTFNALYDAQKQIVITSDRPPKGLATLEDRLVSRFEWGLITDIQPPDLETRVAILRKKVRAEAIALGDDDVLMLIASRVPTNIRELEGCLTRVVAYASFTKRPVDVALATEVLKDIPETPTLRITMDMILSAVAESTGVSITEITGDKRSRSVVEGRHLAMYLARELTDASLPKIGDHIGGRDHTTVLHAVDKVSKLIREDRDMYNRVQRLTAKLKSTR